MNTRPGRKQGLETVSAVLICGNGFMKQFNAVKRFLAMLIEKCPPPPPPPPPPGAPSPDRAGQVQFWHRSWRARCRQGNH